MFQSLGDIVWGLTSCITHLESFPSIDTGMLENYLVSLEPKNRAEVLFQFKVSSHGVYFHLGGRHVVDLTAR